MRPGAPLACAGRASLTLASAENDLDHGKGFGLGADKADNNSGRKAVLPIGTRAADSMMARAHQPLTSRPNTRLQPFRFPTIKHQLRQTCLTEESIHEWLGPTYESPDIGKRYYIAGDHGGDFAPEQQKRRPIEPNWSVQLIVRSDVPLLVIAREDAPYECSVSGVQ